jgi:hypothetical protein
MKMDTRDRLKRLGESSGKEYGKLVQKLLGIAFLESGVERVTERSIQGIDLELAFDERQVAMEVKTTESRSIKLGKKDVEGLKARQAEGYQVYLAVLGNRLLDDWLLVCFHPEEMPAGKDIPLMSLRPFRDAALEGRLADKFDDALARHMPAAIAGGQGALNDILAGYAAFAPA